MIYYLKKHIKPIPFLLCLFIIAEGFSQSKEDTIAQIKEYHNKGRNFVVKQKYDSAIVNFITAYRFSTPEKYSAEHLDVQYSIARLNYYLQNYEKAAQDCIKIIDSLENKNKEEELFRAKSLLGLSYTQSGELEKAQLLLKSADNFYNSKNDEKNAANIWFGLGLLEQKKNNHTTAINYFDAAIPLFKSFDDNYQEAYAEMSKAYSLLQKSDETNNKFIAAAKSSLARSKNIAKKNNIIKLKIESLKIESYIALRENNFALAQEKLELFESKNDSLYQVFLKAISTDIDAETEIINLNAIINQQQIDIENQLKSIHFVKMTTGLSIALIVILSLLTLSLFKNNNLRAKANNLLRDKTIELQLAKEKAEKATLVKAHFLSTITHELRTPLYAVTGLTHLLLEANSKPEQKEHLNSLKFSGEYLLSLINDILDLNKLEANKVEIEKIAFNLKKRINDVLIALRKNADDKNNNLIVEIDETIPNKLLGDPIKLSQILINLIGNALKFTQNGDIYIRVKKIKEKDEKVHLHFEIEDTGEGISKTKQKSIFESFSQASLQVNRKFGGTGLGLSIVKNLLELMGSKIHLESQLGKGSKFWFDINFLIAEDTSDERINKTERLIDYQFLENKKILIVEDNKINQMITKKILEKNKIICSVADNGMDAIKFINENQYDLVLMDIHMPGISGVEATEQIRKTHQNLPIIALTAVTIDENLDDFYRAGFNEIIPKPFKTEEFFTKIHNTLKANTLQVES